MTPTRSNKFSVTFLALTFQLLVIPQILSHLAHPTTATNLNATNPANMTKDDILVMMASHINVSSVYDSFNQFKLFHQVDNDIRIIFQQSKDMKALFQQLERSEYSTIVYMFSNSSITTDNLTDNGLAFCDELSTELSISFNKNVIFWPCPKVVKSEKFLPSYETMSFAVKNIFKEFNWNEAVILAMEPNWGLPLAIAANLHTPYRIEIGMEEILKVDFKDKAGKVLIVCSPLNSPKTRRIISQFRYHRQTRILLIDMMANVFDSENRFYREIGVDERRNLVVLTAVSQKLKQILYSKYRVEFQRYLKTKHHHHPPSTNETIFCDLRVHNSSHYVEKFSADFSTCLRETKRRCSNYTNVDINSYCMNTMIASTTTTTFNKQLVFNSEHLNLFDFVTSMLSRDNSSMNAGNQETNYQYDFIVLDFKSIFNDTNATSWRPLLILEQDELDRTLFTMHRALSEDSMIDWLPPRLWKCETVCWSVIISSISILIILMIIMSISLGIAARNYFLRKRLSKGPNKVVLSTSDFVFPIDSRRVDEGIEAMLCCWLQQLQEFGGPEVGAGGAAAAVEKPDLLKGSIGSLKNLGLPGISSATNKSNSTTSGSLVKPSNNMNMVEFKPRYQGDLVQLKEIINPSGSSIELKTKAMDLLITAHSLRHENINPLIGFLSDPNRTALVFENCSRGSLQDVLIMDEIKLDWSFRLSLLTDLVRGMRYLHSSPLRVHGALTSRNCVVDARWVLKITDYGLPAFYDAQGLTTPSKSAKQLLWTAPEVLRGNKSYSKYGTQAADVFSFGIIMQEVVVRGEPYCMLSLSPEEIITKLKKPPPLIRPSVSKGAAPPEAINIMRQCWSENPELRPDFETIGEKFKLLNHGRKVNFVDTMFQMLEKYSNNLEELIRERTEQLEMERKKTEQLLNRMLPSSVAEKLKVGMAVDPEEFADVTIYFSDIVGFTTIAAHCTPVQVVDLLNDLYTIFDATIMSYPHVYKVETIGDAYMVVGGIPNPRPDHAEQIATMALDLLHQSGNFKVRHLPGVPLQLRIGLHTGPCCAGVVGLTMPRYCLFGDTVNTASRMESTGSSWRIHMSQTTCDRLEKPGGYIIEPRGPIEIKGKGKMNTYWLLGKKGFDKLLPTPPPIGESHGLDELLKKNTENMVKNEAKIANANSLTSSNQSSHSPSVTGGDSLEVKVEITPAPPTMMSDVTNSFSIESTSSLTICSDTSSKSQATSPNNRKYSEMSHDSMSGFLNPMGNFTRMGPTSSSMNTSSNRLFKKIEEMIDLSLPYNHYRCLSPSETNLSLPQVERCMSVSPNARLMDAGKPGSSRLLRRQFSLDKDDLNRGNLETISSLIDYGRNPSSKSNHQMITAASLPSSSSAIGGGNLVNSKLHKHHQSVTDLEKIEEIPISPLNVSMMSSNNGSLNSFKNPTSNNNSKTQTDSSEINLNIENLR